VNVCGVRYLSEEEDVATLAAGISVARRIFATEAFRKIGESFSFFGFI
jgi:hypothetical protein